MSKKCRAFSVSKLGLEPADNRKAFYAGWDAAIEQAEKQEPVGYIDSIGNFQNTRLDDRDTPVYTNPPTAPAQQPLNDFDMRGVLASRLLCWHRLTEAEAQDLICFFEGVRRPAPAQQPLTDERVQWLIDGMPNYDSWGRVVRDGIVNLHEFARAIEQAHGIKGASL